jgi:hypothetical protein
MYRSKMQFIHLFLISLLALACLVSAKPSQAAVCTLSSYGATYTAMDDTVYWHLYATCPTDGDIVEEVRLVIKYYDSGNNLVGTYTSVPIYDQTSTTSPVDHDVTIHHGGQLDASTWRYNYSGVTSAIYHYEIKAKCHDSTPTQVAYDIQNTPDSDRITF